MPFAASLSTQDDTAAALRETTAQLGKDLGGPASLAFVFFSPHHSDQAETIAAALCDVLQTENLLGCAGESIVGGSREIEGQPAIAVWAARLPNAAVLPFPLQFEQADDGGAFQGWPQQADEILQRESALLLLGDPFSFPADVLIAQLNDDRPGVPVIGGMASGGWAPRQNKLLLGREVFEEGAVAALIHGDVSIRTVVSQGCRPVGRHFVVTRSDRNVILELSGQPAMQRLHEVYESLSPDEKMLVRQGLHVGRVLSEYQDQFRRGDFLVRNVVGADPQSGAIAIGDYVRTGQTVQFHIRDAQSADEDLRELLREATASQKSSGALLFTCNGRGTRLFPEPNHDAACVQAALGGVSLAGFFAQGELGPIGQKNFLHGFTASIALFESK